MRFAPLLGLWLALVPAGAEAGRMTDHGQVGAWETFTWFTDAGEFSYCAAVTTDQAGRELFISVGRDGLAFSIDAPGQRLQQGRVMPVIVHIDEETVFAPVDAAVFGPPGQNVLLVLSPAKKLAASIKGPASRLASVIKAIEEKLEKGEAIAKLG